MEAFKIVPGIRGVCAGNVILLLIGRPNLEFVSFFELPGFFCVSLIRLV